MVRRIAAVAVLLGFIVGTAGCNTVEGVGQDVQKGGQAIERAADKNKPK